MTYYAIAASQGLSTDEGKKTLRQLAVRLTPNSVVQRFLTAYGVKP
jgi:hypothetical protein